MIRAIIFDFGNVLYLFNNDLYLSKLAKYGNITKKKLSEIIFDSGLSYNFEKGLISADRFYNDLINKAGLSIKKDTFIKIYSGKLTRPIFSNHSLVKRLKRNGYVVSLLSNTNVIDFENVIKKIEIFNLFDTVTLSFEVKSVKPEKEIYIDAIKKIKKMGICPKECVFIDDLEENVRGAEKIGMQAIHYTSHNRLVESLKKLNVKC